MKLLLIAAIVLYLFGSFRRPVFIAALTLQLVYLGLRGAALGRLPLIGPQDTLTFFSASIGLMAIPFLYARDLRSSSTFSWGTGCLTGLFALMALPFPTLNMPLPPILNTYWFELHVALAFFAYALFGIGALLAGMFLRYREKSLLDLQYKTALVGYSFFSASMVSGGIWGYYAWGTYWLWTPKELWTSILWLFYSLYLHLRLQGPRWERTVAWAAIIGFGVAIFTYLGVSMLMKSSHSF
ncbi:ResC/HemX-like cytochrome c biogenesis membrane protein [Geotalea daltonii FRC-32]|uniref:ResC/HemX-like cytochrome c biogenesis membrane protein n=1 Tax=Geotalea daltonii (strain DSM 22248 / JCM 15807 / FRC-32) TaxID=316067 RepID=B9M7N6_GEODF|nr:cytochrome c biogenesis protein CcsA [Geotalea daltonii]ACM22142.1 ResC/HemX-like cytochrome c biogenesis membrane protein [Geotalea daltonii FRC-32]